MEQRSCGCSILGSLQGKVRWDYEQPSLVESAPAHGRGLETRSVRGIFQQKPLWFYEIGVTFGPLPILIWIFWCLVSLLLLSILVDNLSCPISHSNTKQRKAVCVHTGKGVIIKFCDKWQNSKSIISSKSIC